MVELIDGTAVAATIRGELGGRVAVLARQGIAPGLAVVLVGDDPASLSYVKGKTSACAELNIRTETLRLPACISQEELLKTIAALNDDPRYHGILVQLPLPKHIDEHAVIDTLAPHKDVDGLHPYNLGRLLRGDPRFTPSTPAGIQQLLLRSGHDPAGKQVVICGRSDLVGKPLAAMLMQKASGANATVTVCHSVTPDLPTLTRSADILVVAIGRPRMITREMVRPGAVVIDVGIHRVPDASRKSGWRLTGDVDFDSVKEVACAITPVPGGVGPMTVTMLVSNTVLAAETCSLAYT